MASLFFILLQLIMNKIHTSNRFITWVLLLPTILFLTLTAFIPILYSVGLSFYNMKINMPNIMPKFVGFENYARMFTDRIFTRSTINTVIFAVLSVLLELTIGIIKTLYCTLKKRK